MKRLKSVFTDNMDRCIETGRYGHIERHHIFESRQGFKKSAEEDGFVIPLLAELHPNGAFVSDYERAHEIDIKWKRKAQEYYEEHYGTREEFMERYGRNYL